MLCIAPVSRRILDPIRQQLSRYRTVPDRQIHRWGLRYVNENPKHLKLCYRQEPYAETPQCNAFAAIVLRYRILCMEIIPSSS